MKRILISLVLIFAFTFGAVVFSACGNAGYDMSKLKTDLYSTCESQSNIKSVNGEITIDYSVYTNSGQKYLQIVVNNSSSKYFSLAKLQALLNNSLAFTYSYLNVVQTNNLSNDAKHKDAIKSCLDSMNLKLTTLSSTIDYLASTVKTNEYNYDATSPLDVLKLAINDYLAVLQKSTELNDLIIQYYYKYALKNANPKIPSKENFNASTVVNLFNTRIEAQKSALTQNYLEMNLFGSNIATDITTNHATINFNLDNYQTNLNALHTVDIDIANERATSASNRDNFYNIAVRMYNMQVVMENEHNKIQIAYRDFDYSKLSPASTEHEKLCASIMESHASLIGEYQTALTDALAILTPST